MYAAHFGLTQAPFSIAPDPRFLYLSERHREALAHLLYGLEAGGGVVLLTGEIGAGKTTVCRAFLEQLPPGCELAYIYNPRLTVAELLQTVCDEFHVPVAATDGPPTVKDRVDALNAHLLATHARGGRSLLVIDEAQNLDASLLEQLRLLTNLETAERKLLQILLIGQPELRGLLKRRSMEALAQRIVARWHLGPLDAEGTRAYVGWRLQVAGLRGEMPFTPRALDAVFRESRGVPRRINLLCDRAMLGAYGQGSTRVEAGTVRQAAREVFGTDVRPARESASRAVLAGGAALALLGGVALWAAWLAGRGPQGPSTAAAVAASAAPAVVASAPMARPPAAASAAPASASGAVAVAPPAAASAPPAAPLDDATLDALAWPARDAAVRELAALWSVPDDVDPCAPAAQRTVACWRTLEAGLTLLRQLDRPALLGLTGPGGGVRWVRVQAVDTQAVTLRRGAQQARLPLAQLAGLWRGELLTLWRLAAADAARTRADAQVVALLDDVSKAVGANATAASAPPGLRERVAAYQVRAGLQADGLPGPLTRMHLNRDAGVDEPRLDPTR